MNHGVGDITGKRQKLAEPNKETFRAWSTEAEKKPGKIFTIKCTLGNPDEPVSSYLKSADVGFIKKLLNERGLSTQGTKAVLLQRFQKDLPWVRLEIDGRECVQRLVNAVVHYFGWDNDHLFALEMPRRGPLPDGSVPLMDTINIDIYCTIQMNGGSLEGMDQKRRAHCEKRLRDCGCTMEDVRTVMADEDAPSKVRKITGAAFCPFQKEGMEKNVVGQGLLSLENLCIDKGDEIALTYDFGDDRRFCISVENTECNSEIIGEVELGSKQLTRARLLAKGSAKEAQYRYESYC